MMKRGWIAGVVVGSLLACSQAAWAGPLILAGHDADDHGFVSVYTDLFNALFTNVTNGNSGILAIGASPASTASGWISAIGAGMDTPQAVTLVNDAAISGVDFSSFAILHIPSDISDTGGGISAAENALLTARADDVADFVNAGGGLFGLTQGVAFADPYGYLTGAGGLGAFTTLGAPTSGAISGSLFDNVDATTEGEALGLTDTNVDGCCWHNVFTAFPGFLDVLATADEPTDPAFDGEAAVLGGVSVTIVPITPTGVIPEPSSMLLFGLGGVGAGFIRRRKKLSS